MISGRKSQKEIDSNGLSNAAARDREQPVSQPAQENKRAKHRVGDNAGQIEEVTRYCESDVLNTYRVWLVYELFRGAITAKELDWSETQVKDFVASRKATNPHLCIAVGIRTHDAIPTEAIHRTEPAD